MDFGMVYVDCGGLDLLKGTKQTIAGIYNRCKEAMKTGKIVVAYNLYWGTEAITPVHVFLIQLETNLITATASTLQIRIEHNNKVQVVNLAPAN